jgi:2-phosphosulfolactate phosphatase
MQLEVVFTPTELPVVLAHASGLTCGVIDVVRATTTLTVIGERGGVRVVLAENIAAARDLGSLQPGSLLAGEIDGARPPGFDLGNSPAELGVASLAGRTIVLATTNGTGTLRACCARGVPTYVASLRNAGAVADLVLHLAPDASFCLVCSGRMGRVALDDTIAAGTIARLTCERAYQASIALTLTEQAQMAIALAESTGDPLIETLRRSDAAQAVIAVGLSQDLDWCAAVDVTPVLPRVSAEPDGTMLVTF